GQLFGGRSGNTFQRGTQDRGGPGGLLCGRQPAKFERELHRLRGYQFKRLLVIGTESDIRTRRYFSGVNPASVLATLYAFAIRYDVPVIFSPTPQTAA